MSYLAAAHQHLRLSPNQQQDNQPLLMHSSLRLLLFFLLFYSVGFSLKTLLSVSSHFLQVFLWASILFIVFRLPLRIPSMLLAFVRGGISNTEGRSSSCLLSCEFKH